MTKRSLCMWFVFAGLLAISACAVDEAEDLAEADQELGADKQDPAKFAPQVAEQDDGGATTNGSGFCVEPLCSATRNESSLGVYVGRDWQCGGTTGTAGGENCAAAANRKWIYTGESTPAWNDWDTFRVDAGYCYKVHFILPYDSWDQYYNRSGTSAVWVKVEDHGVAVVKAQRYGSCP